MKKQILFCVSLILMLFLSSCSTEELNNEVIKSENSRFSTGARVPGDGLYDILGYGYNAAGEYANANSAGFQVIDVNRFKTEQPARLISENTFSQDYVEEYGENAQLYSNMISTKVGATGLFKKALSLAVNGTITSSYKFDAKYIYGSYNLTIKQRRFRFNATTSLLSDYATPEFTEDLQSKTPQQIVADYGTHVAMDIYTGAKMDVMFQSETTNVNRENAARIGIKAGIKDIFDVDINNEINTTSSTMNYSKKLSYRTRGGDPSKGLVGDLDLQQTNSKVNIANWQNSSNISNAVLVDFGPNGLVLIYEFVKDAAKKAQLKAYVDQYLIDNRVVLEYNSIPVYGFYNGNHKDHYLAISPAIPNGYVSEGETFRAYNYKVPNTQPIYQFYSTSDRDHYYSTSSAVPNKYYYEKIAFYAATSSAPTNKPIYQYYSGSDKDHYYTKILATPNKYYYEKIAFYGF